MLKITTLRDSHMHYDSMTNKNCGDLHRSLLRNYHQRTEIHLSANVRSELYYFFDKLSSPTTPL